ncbi:MAG TPA: hypothetical protein VFQ70_04390 [Candidatus Saccharimonadaceae bacterium]|nr:hypothetical protein [Candidatus Saccharimonadaceae bacterium]
MAKQKKKRNKSYRGEDAKNARPDIVRISAANRSALGQWLYEHRKLLRPVLIGVGIAILVVIVIIGIVGIVNS